MLLTKLALESHKIGRFGLVGLTATGVHMLVFSCLLELTQMSAVAANLFAFICAVVFSFFGNRNWTFTQQVQNNASTSQISGFSAVKYTVVAVSGFAFNGVLALFIVDRWMLPYAVAVIPMVLLTPLFTYLATRFWVLGN